MGASQSGDRSKTQRSKSNQLNNNQPKTKIATIPFNSRSQNLKKLKSPLDVADFTSFYKHMGTKLWNENFRFTHPDDLMTFEKKLALCNRVCIDVAHIWIAAYVDYMIYFAWNELTGKQKLCYPPYGVQQVARLHSLYTVNYQLFCGLIYKEKSHLYFSPFKIIARQEASDYNTARNIYHEDREFLFKNLYQNPAMHKSIISQRFTETVWEDFEMTVLKSEFSFSFLDGAQRDNFGKIINREAEHLMLKAHTPQEFFRVAKVLRSQLGVSDLISDKQPVTPRLLDQFVSQEQLTPSEREAAT